MFWLCCGTACATAAAICGAAFGAIVATAAAICGAASATTWETAAAICGAWAMTASDAEAAICGAKAGAASVTRLAMSNTSVGAKIEAIPAMSGEFSGLAVARFVAAARIASPPCAMAASNAPCCCGKRFGGDPAKVFGGVETCISATAAFTALMTPGLTGPEAPFALT